MLIKRYKHGVEARITMTGPGDIVSATVRWPGGETGPYTFPNEAWAIREIEHAVLKASPKPSKLGIVTATLLMLTVAALFAGLVVHWLASLPAAVLMALLLLGRNV